MDELIKTIVLFPYSTPEKTNNVFNTSLPIKDTIQTLFFDIDLKTQYIQNPKEFKSMLDQARYVIPTKIIKLTCNELTGNCKPNLYSQNIPLWISALSDPYVQFFSLASPPVFGAFSLSDFLENCIDNQIAPDRAAEGIYSYCTQKNISSEVLTRELISKPQYSTANPDYFAKFGYALYIRNLVIPSKFILFLIQNLEPKNIEIFKEEILPSYSLLYYAFHGPNSERYIRDTRIDLLRTKSQIIQFSIISQIYQENSFQKHFDKFLKMNPELKHRVIRICNITLSQLAFSSMFRNILFCNYPYFDIEYFKSNIERMITFSEDDEIIDHLLIMCKSVLWFDQHLNSVSSIVAYMIKIFVDKQKAVSLKKNAFQFPLNEFIDLLYENIEKINNFVYLFAELQYHELFHYFEFLYLIYSKRGLFVSKPNETKILFSSLPWSSCYKEDLRMVKSALIKSFPEMDIKRDFGNYLADKNIYSNIDKVQQLPFVLRYHIAFNLIRQTREFLRPAVFLLQIGAPNLIVPLFENAAKNNSIELTLNFQALIEDMIPCFSCHNSLESLVKYLISEPNHPICNEILLFLLKHYKGSSEISQKSKYRSQLNEIAKSLNADQKTINNEQFNSLFYRFSFYCSLNVYDSFASIRTFKDFQSVMSTFFRELFNFSMLSYDGLMKFFNDFSQSRCIKRPSIEFLKLMLDAIIANNEFENNFTLHSILTQFFSEILHLKIVDPSFFFDMIFAGIKKSRGKQQSMALRLITIVIEIIKNGSSVFNLQSILTESVVKHFVKLFPQENNPIIDLLAVLRTYPPQVITEDMLSYFENNKMTGLTYSSAIFSLLPEQLMADDFVDVSEFFKLNVSRSTSTFWTLWLKWRPYYQPGFPVLEIQPDDDAVQLYRQQLISTFLSLLYHSKENEEQTLIYLNCWTLLCTDLAFSKMILQNTKDQLTSNNLPLSSKLITFLNPPLVLSDKNEELFESLCLGISNYHYDSSQFEQFVKFGTCIFAIFVSKFSQNSELIPMILAKILEWISKLFEQNSSELESTIDIFNFIVCFSYHEAISPEKNPIDTEDSHLQTLIHETIQNHWELIPKSLRPYILVNIPLQKFRSVKPPLLSTVHVEEEPPPPEHKYSPPDQNDNNNAFQFDTPLFPFDEDTGNNDIWGFPF